MCQQTCNKNHPDVANIIEQHKHQQGSLLVILKQSQEVIGYLPKEVLQQIAAGLQLSESKVYGVATFYSQFHLRPRGKHIIRVCMGTACHVRGSDKILNKLQEELQIKVGETTTDLQFSLESVACIGACGLAPVITIDGRNHGKLLPENVQQILNSYRKELIET